MPPYDDRLFAPPAAVLNAHLRNPQNGTIIQDVLLLIDTGADVTLLPLGAVNAAGIEQTGASYELLTFDGRSSAVGVVRRLDAGSAAPPATSAPANWPR